MIISCSFHILDTIIICESYMANISCSEPQATIDITFARYGRTSTALCRNTTRPHSRTDCTGVVTSAVRNKCNGRNACELHASNSVYGDPCQNTYKYMEVTYECKPGISPNLGNTLCLCRFPVWINFSNCTM